MFNEKDFKQYRLKMGYTRQDEFKKFLSAKDIVSGIDFSYIEDLNDRLAQIFRSINNIYYKPKPDLECFLNDKLFGTYSKIMKAGILNKLNNQGRRKEEVYYSWMRGFLSCEYFKEAIAEIFDVSVMEIKNIGDDNFESIENFKRTPKADLEIEKMRIEIQSGFQGINDVKEHKVREAKRVYQEFGIHTLIIHVDLFNGQVAFLDLTLICDNDLNWITRQQMEGQTVFNIDQNHFKWLFWDTPPCKNSFLNINE